MSQGSRQWETTFHLIVPQVSQPKVLMSAEESGWSLPRLSLSGRHSPFSVGNVGSNSEHLRTAHDLIAGQPRIDLELEVRLQKLCLEAGRSGLLQSAHDCSRGGLAVALAECCIDGALGLLAPDAAVAGRLDAALFGEAPSRIVVSTRDGARLQAFASEHHVPCLKLGVVSGDRLVLREALDLAVADMRDAYEGGLPAALGQPA